MLEVGPGLGSLTLGLLEAGATVTCIEKDEEMAELARIDAGPARARPTVEVVVADALDVDLRELTGTAPSWRSSPTCPTTSSTQIVLRVLDEAPAVTRCW